MYIIHPLSYYILLDTSKTDSSETQKPIQINQQSDAIKYYTMTIINSENIDNILQKGDNNISIQYIYT